MLFGGGGSGGAAVEHNSITPRRSSSAATCPPFPKGARGSSIRNVCGTKEVVSGDGGFEILRRRRSISFIGEQIGRSTIRRGKRCGILSITASTCSYSY